MEIKRKRKGLQTARFNSLISQSQLGVSEDACMVQPVEDCPSRYK